MNEVPAEFTACHFKPSEALSIEGTRLKANLFSPECRVCHDRGCDFRPL